VTIESWRILKILEMVQSAGGRVTLANLADLVRGLGGGTFGVVDEGHGQGKKRKAKLGAEKGSLDVQGLTGGKVELNKEVSGSVVEAD
jgi:ATP-dependent DNA helicase Q1